MDDRAIIASCAEATGWRAFKETRGDYTLCVSVAEGERMPWERVQRPEPERYTEVSLAEAMKIGFFGRGLPNPLHDDAQAMALVKRFKLLLTPDGDSNWICSGLGGEGCSESPDLNRAICLAVAMRGKE